MSELQIDFSSIPLAQPIAPEAHNKLGKLLCHQGKLKEAEACFRQALRLQPSHAGAHINLGNVLCDQGQLEAGVACYREALRLRPDYAEVHCNMGVALREQGRLEEAEASFLRALDIKPHNADWHFHLGNVYRDQGKLEQAEISYRQALHFKPNLAEAHNNLGLVLWDRGRLVEAKASFCEALRLKPDFSGAHNNLGIILYGQAKLEEAEISYRQALRFQPDFAEAHNNLGDLLQDQAKLKDAEASYRQALYFRPDFAEAHHNLGKVLRDQGKLKEAEQSVRAALRHNPRLAGAWSQLATLLGGRLPDSDLETMRRVRANPGLTCLDRAALCFGLAQVLDARREFEQAAEHLAEANALTLDHCRQRGESYDPGGNSQFVDRLLAAFSTAFFERVRGLGANSEMPIFIVGLQRSGTTLVEHILASHSQVFGAGELTLAPDNFLRLAGDGGDHGRALDNLSRLDGPVIRNLADWHLGRLRAIHPGARHVADKLNDNYLLLGFLAALFPRAKFIHCRRDLRDIAVSCWMNSFRSVRWANAFEHIAARCHDYERVMNHWRQVLPVPVLEVDYEETITDLERTARRLVSWCGLDWEPACLRFHENTRPVRTASAVQVRQPIFSHSVARWKNYEKSLGTLFAMLPHPTRSSSSLE